MSNRDTINRYILEESRKGNLDREMSLLMLKEINRNRDNAGDDSRGEIAITGIACKFPCADNSREYWLNLKNGVEVIRSFPERRARELGRSINMKAGWLENISGFDAGFFRISPKEAISMHPSQRMFLETAWEAIEDAGYANEGLFGSKTGVYVGIDHTYQMEYNKMTDQQDLLIMTGSMTSVLASRIAYVFNLHGPNLVVDTACSSGLVATHLACKALKSKECDMAIAGGINLIRQINANFDGVESEDGKLCAFDKKSKGTVWGEGLGFVILKPLEKALKDRDNIYAVIKGSAIGNDGTTNGITAPSAETQAETILNAWEDAGINPETISYIEAHATGTVLGDPIEAKGIKTAFEKHTDRKQFCGIGSVKPNIGHGVSAAAVSSLLKVVLAMRNGQIPPNINFSEPNPYIDFSDSPIYVNDRLKKWESGEGNTPRRAGVSSFGFSRTNCHIVLEEAPKLPESTGKEGPYVFTLSAKSESALKAYIGRYCEFVREFSGFNPGDVCFTAGTGRMHYSNRIAMLVKDRNDFVRKLSLLRDTEFGGMDEPDIFYGEHKVVVDGMKQNRSGEITKSEKNEMNKSAAHITGRLEDLKDGPLQKELREICRMYVKGADIEWTELYKGDLYKKISLPTYPFEHKHYWMKQQEPAAATKPEVKGSIHPLIDRCLARTLDQEVYLTEFCVDRHWVLTEHVIMGLNVVPGITYLEMAREAAKGFCRDFCVELRDVVFTAPLIVDKHRSKEVHTIIRKEDGCFSFKIASRQKSEDAGAEDIWAVHAEGRIHPEVERPSVHVNTESLLGRCSKERLAVDMSLPMGGFTFGPRWRNVSGIYIGDDEILTELELDGAFKGDTGEFVLHPALLDNSINLAIEKLIHNVEDGMYLPLSYKSIKVYKPIPEKLFSLQRINTPLIKGMQTVSLDITLIDASGEVIADVQGYTVKKVISDVFRQAASGNSLEQYHTTGWVSRKIQGTKAAPEKILVFKDEKGISDKVVSRLRPEGKNIIEVSYGDSFKRLERDSFEVGPDEVGYVSLIDEIKEQGFTQILHFMSISPNSETDSLPGLEDGKSRGLFSLLYLTRTLIAEKLNNNLDIMLFSDYVDEVTGREQRINPHNAPMFALGKVASNEYNGLSIRCIDIDGNVTAEELLGEISASEDVYKVAYRDGNRYAEVFDEFDVETAPRAEVEIKDTGIYLITGGAGGIGLEVARYLAAKNKVNIAFINRSKLPDRADWERVLSEKTDNKLCGKLRAIKEIEDLGATVVCCRADVSSYSDMKNITEKLRREFGRINGVVHSAGLPGEGLIIKLDEGKFKKVLAPKIEGTWLLDRFTRADKPDFFIMFSSILSLAGVMGQADYAAANAYMDSFAAYRNKAAGKTATINWTVWNETGMAQDYNTDELRGLFKTVTNAAGIEALDNTVNRDIKRLVVGELDFVRIASSGGGLGLNLSPEFKVKVEKRCSRINASAIPEDKRQEVQVAVKGEEKVNDTEMKIVRVWAEVLTLEEVRLSDSFSELGGDSIIAASLLKAMNKEFDGMLDISDIFTYPTIKQMAEYIDKKSGKDNGPDKKTEELTEAAARTEERIEEILNRLARGEITMGEADEMIKSCSKVNG